MVGRRFNLNFRGHRIVLVVRVDRHGFLPRSRIHLRVTFDNGWTVARHFNQKDLIIVFKVYIY